MHLRRAIPIVTCAAAFSGVQYGAGYAQARDSTYNALRNELAQSKRDSARIRILVALGQIQRRVSIDEASGYADEANLIAQDVGVPALQASSLLLLANIAIDKSRFTSAMYYALQGLTAAEESGDKLLCVRALGIVGTVHRLQNNVPKAFEYAWKALALANQEHYLSQEAQILSNLGSAHRRLQQYDSARHYRLRSLAIYETLRDSNGIADVCMGIGAIEEADNQPLKSLSYKQRALVIYSSLDDELGKADALTGIGKSYISLQNSTPQYGDSAEMMLQRGLEIAKRIDARLLILRSAEELYRFHKARNNTAEALRWHETYAQMRDSVFSTEETTRLAEMQSSFDRERESQQRDVERLQRNFSLAFLGIAVVFIAVLVNRFRLKSISEELLKQKQEALEFEHQRAELLLSNILPQAIADRLKMGETTIADTHQAATILFADIVGFTEIATQLSARETVRLLDQIFSAFDVIAAKYHLEKIKTIGDEYMVVAGIPHPNPDHCKAIAAAALEMLAAVETMSVPNTTVPHLHLRLGMHTGDVVAGVIGQKKFAYDLWGDTVNTASRMESHGTPQKIHCSEAVYRALKNEFVFEECGFNEIKGKGMMRTYFLLHNI